LCFSAAIAHANPTGQISHRIKVTLSPASHELDVVDEITLPVTSGANGGWEFLLHAGLQPTATGARLTSLGALNDAPGSEESVPTQRFRLDLNPGQQTVTVKYRGQIHHPVSDTGEEYARSFHETPGLISNDGIFLAGSSLWYPHFEGQSVSFTLETLLPIEWRSVSQGTRLLREATSSAAHDVWQDLTPQEEIYLIAAPFHEFTQAAGAVQAMVFLRAPEQALAQKYLDATAQYIEMYRELIGPYPYGKFALVENFWETGYGMPSFTLLGSKVVRLPFIIASSYPHEILHNWWGNGVFVDLTQGNWSEGLTSYMADQLLREQQGDGAPSRRSVLQNYTDFVSSAKDFPLSQFRARHSSSSEAVGYGKSQMLFHMLREEVGDENFIKSLHRFYGQFKFKSASFTDLANVFSAVSQRDLKPFFAQWVEGTGAPQLALRDVKISEQNGQFELSATLTQLQQGPPYQLRVPIAISLADQDKALQQTVAMTERDAAIKLTLPHKPLRIDIDPEFDVFRRLDRAEIPPALSQAFGAEKALIVLPAGAPDELLTAYRQLAETWRSTQASGIETALDIELKKLPKDRAIWLLGWENRFVPYVMSTLKDYDVAAQPDSVRIGEHTLMRQTHAVILTARTRDAQPQALAWIATANPKAVPGLASKLPHYRKYSYLAFTGDEPTNVAKGQWPVLRSPMTAMLTPNGNVATAKLTERHALAELPSVFSEARILADVRALAAADKEGRGLGSKGLELAANYLVEAFRRAGLQPGLPAEKSYVQTWTEHVPGLKRDVTLKNIIGVMPGNNPALAGQSVIISAHYDHLGMGWPGAKKGNEGKLHPGADDNASGLAVMLELARLAAQKWQPERTLVFVAFSGEEAERLGSLHYLRNYETYPANKAIGVINLDTVGRLGNAPVTVFGTGSAREWPHIIRGAQFVTGVNVNPVANDLGFSDQRTFLDAGIPAVQLFGTAHQDFHSPGDTADKIDGAGLVKVATILKEAASYLADRPEPLSFTGETTKAATSQATPATARQVSLGTVPDYGFPGPGVRVTDVVAGSPAQTAGIQSGDVLTTIERVGIKDVAEYAQILRNLAVGQKISVSYTRNGKVYSVELETAPR